MKLWHCAGARSFRALWALEEIGLPYDLEVVPFPPRFAVPGWLDVNPLGTIPFFTDGATAMTESAAIADYVATRYGGSLAVRADEPDYGAYLNWLHHGEATLTFPQTIVLRYRVFEPAKGVAGGGGRLCQVVRQTHRDGRGGARKPRLAVRRALHRGRHLGRLRAQARRSTSACSPTSRRRSSPTGIGSQARDGFRRAITAERR